MIQQLTSSAMSREQIIEVIARRAREVLPDLAAHRFVASDSLEQLGANSMDRAEIVTFVLEDLGLRIPRTSVFGPKNVGELAELLHGKLHA